MKEKILRGALTVLFVALATPVYAGSFTVNSTLDTADASAGDGICNDGSGNCTLRAALQEAQFIAGGSDTVTFSVTGTISPTSQLPEISDSGMTITGPGSASLTISGSLTGGGDVLSISGDSNTFSGFTVSTPASTSSRNIYLFGANNNSFTDIVSQDGPTSSPGIEVVSSSGNTFTNCVFSDSNIGIRFITNSNNNTVTNSSAADNSHSGMTSFNSTGNTFSNNTYADSGDTGMYIIGATNTIIRGGTFSNFGGAAITVLGSVENPGSVGTLIENNEITNAVYSITVDEGSSDTTIQNNSITDAFTAISIIDVGGYTIVSGNTISNSNQNAISVSGVSDGVQILDNTITTVAVYSGIRVDADAVNAVVDGNTVIDPTESGIIINGSGSVINDNEVSSSSGTGISILGDNTTLTANYVHGTTNAGIFVQNTSGLVVGGTTTGQGNTISGNGTYGLQIDTVSDVTIQGNYFGLDTTGTSLVTPLGSSQRSGIYLGAVTDITIGGSTTAARNYIVDSGAGTRGITLTSTITNALISGNYIGLNKDGDVVGSLANGISINSSVDGSTTIIEKNVISGVTFGATAFGISLQSGAGNFRIFDNKIGTNPLGDVESGYENDIGIAVLGGSGASTGNQIGGVGTGKANKIVSSSMGVLILQLVSAYSTGNSILGNSILGNAIQGIELAIFTGSTLNDTGSNANDAGDGDSGPNDYLNKPVINTVDTVTGEVVYTLDVPAGDYRVEFFKNPTYGTYGAGEVYLGADTFTSTGSAKSRTRTFALSSGDFITATATQDLGGGLYGSTSEFSQAYAPEEVVGTPEDGDILGCMDPDADNYNSSATVDDDSCTYPEEEESGGGGGGGSAGSYVCKDPKAVNYSKFGINDSGKCRYEVADVIGSGTCPANLIIHNFMKRGDRNGKYSAYNNGIVTEVGILQAHINRILAAKYTQAAGPVDGIFGVLTAQGVARLQVALNETVKPTPFLKIDGIVGPFTREAINGSCGQT